MIQTPKFSNRFFDTLCVLSYWFSVAAAAASALAVLAAVVLAIVSGYADRPKLAEAAGTLLGRSLIGLIIFLILARQTRKRRTLSKEMRTLDGKWEELGKRVQEAKKRRSASGDWEFGLTCYASALVFRRRPTTGGDFIRECLRSDKDPPGLRPLRSSINLY